MGVETHEQFAIQVKTTGYKQKKWTLAKKNEELIGDNIFYVFVSLNELDTPEYHIVPSRIVAETIKTSHQKWLETPGKKGQKHNDTNIRVFVDNEDVFYDKWHLLEMKVVDDKKLPKGTYESLISFIPRLKSIEYGKVQPEFHLNRYNDVMLLNGLKWDEEAMTNADVSCLNGQAVMSLL